MKNAVALGTFDGLHKGHLAVLNLPDCYNKIALTFEKPPKADIKGEAVCLMTFNQKKKRLEAMGFRVEKLRFGEVSDISAEDFLLKIKEEFNPSLISCGFNYRFGKGGRGDTALLKSFCGENGIDLMVCEPVEEGGALISSSRIRDLVNKGKIGEANSLLGTPFSFEGEVLHGDGRGKGLGFPTINQRFPEEMILPKKGVYFTAIETDGKRYFGITDIGNRPTYPVDYIISETYIDDFSGDLYGKPVKIELLDFLRSEKKFNSPEELTDRINDDIKEMKKRRSENGSC